MASEFDRYAREYSELLRDPIRDRFAQDPRFFYLRKLALIRHFFERHGRETAAARWVDIGCGRGELLRMGKPYFAEVAGCDASAQMLAACPDLHVRHQLVPSRLPFPTEAYDLVTAVCVYHHVDPSLRGPLTGDALRVLKPGGIICIIEHNPFNPVTRLVVRRTRVDVHARLVRPGTVARLLRTAGASIVDTRFFMYLPERLYSRFPRVEERLAAVPLGGQYAVFGRRIASRPVR